MRRGCGSSSGPDRSAPPGIWRRTSTGKATPPPMARSSTPSPPEGAPETSGTRVSRPSRCGTPHTHPGSWRAVWAYSKKRAARDNQTLTAQANRARGVIAGEKRPKGTRFVTVHAGDATLDEASIARARSLVGLKGYVTNISSHLMDAGGVVSSYHELWHARSVFSDEQARPESPSRLPPPA